MSEEEEIPKQLPEEPKAETRLKAPSIPESETQPTNMEVPHHPNVEKKNFKEYFLEFLMIFLAVTMGFFAENVRETYKDKENVHQLTISLINDLKIDTARLAYLLQRSTIKIKKLDSLYAIVQQPKDK
jgi:hypothetical protein